MEENDEIKTSFKDRHRIGIDIFTYVVLIIFSIFAVSKYADPFGVFFYGFNSILLLIGITLFKLYYKKNIVKFYGWTVVWAIIVTFIEVVFYNAFNGVLKPVIYLYPEKEEEIYVKLNFNGELKVTYPKYDESICGWKVKASPNGKIVNLADNKEYSYLFWEGLSKTKYDFKSGFVVQGKDTEKFLQNSLSSIGLIPKE
jgi:energy-coupling factor transporter transmembrane protein EcfT